MELRRWQAEAKTEVEKAWANGIMCPTVVAPTGSGKTALAAALISDFNGPVVFTAHRDQLITQTQRAFLSMIPGRTIGIIRGDDNQVGADVIVASLQTLASGRRLQEYLDANPPSLVIADEAHMSGAPIFASIFEQLGTKGRRIQGLGLSATLYRETGTKLHELWDNPVYQMDLREAIEDGICVPPRGIRVHLPNGTSLMEAARDIAAWADNLSTALEATDVPSTIAQAIADHCDGRAVIGFAPNVRAALVLTEACRIAGISAETITASTPSSVRDDLFAASQAGDLRVLWSVDTISVGADLPWVSAVVVARDTGSQVWWVQALGRGLRTYPGKTDCIILDCSSSSKRFRLDTFFDLGEDQADSEGSERAASATTMPEIEALGDMDKAEIGLVEYSGFDFFARESAWLTTLGGVRFVSAFQRIIFVLPDEGGSFTVGSVPDNVFKTYKAKRHVRELPLADAVRYAEILADQCDRGTPTKFGKQMKISSRAASWRQGRKELTEGQINMINAFRPELVDRACSHVGASPISLHRAQASTVIGVCVASAILSRLGLDTSL